MSEIKLSKMHNCFDGKQRIMCTPVRDIGDGSDKNQNWVPTGEEYCSYCRERQKPDTNPEVQPNE